MIPWDFYQETGFIIHSFLALSGLNFASVSVQVHVEFFERYARGNKAYYSAGSSPFFITLKPRVVWYKSL